MSDSKYNKLDKSIEYDEEASEQLAEALNEIHELQGRIGNLRELVDENRDLHETVWRTIEGKAIAVHKLETDHLQNILNHLTRNNYPINKTIRSEARKRGLLIPMVPVGMDGQHYIEMREELPEDF